jgi:hypothetical protein
MLALILDHDLGGEVQRYPLSHFHEVSWAVGPSRQSGVMRREEAEQRGEVHRRITADRAV